MVFLGMLKLWEARHSEYQSGLLGALYKNGLKVLMAEFGIQEKGLSGLINTLKLFPRSITFDYEIIESNGKIFILGDSFRT